jgi:hypothetical protein
MANPPITANTKYTFAQIEAFWIGAGGSAAEAPMMAAIAEAESGGSPMEVAGGGTNIKNSTDGFGGSVGLWQINGSSFGVTDSTPPSQGGATMSAADVAAMQDPLQNAKQALAMFNARGLNPWKNDHVAQPLMNAGYGAPGQAPPSLAEILSVGNTAGVSLTGATDLTNMTAAQIITWCTNVLDGPTGSIGGIPAPGTGQPSGGAPGVTTTNSGQGPLSTAKNAISEATSIGGVWAAIFDFLTTPSGWLRIAEGSLALGLVVFGSVIFFKSTATGQKVEGAATSAATAAAVG